MGYEELTSAHTIGSLWTRCNSILGLGNGSSGNDYVHFVVVDIQADIKPILVFH